ncbi:hypothetical protein DFH09DRAFT_474799 [Mycena vulgaris]|nr:hypothetical protein DFH09DRAFT_474799 [Mycena vulgaris]
MQSTVVFLKSSSCSCTIGESGRTFQPYWASWPSNDTINRCIPQISEVLKHDNWSVRSDVPTGNVVLIPDILRVIFEIAATADRRTALNLVLVSHLVQNWIDIVLYKTVQLYRQRTSNNFVRTLETSPKSRAFFATHVKSLCILFDMPVDHVVRITSVCYGIENLTTWFLRAPHSGPPGIPLSHFMFFLRPRRLSAWHGVLHSPDPHLALPFFSRVTHLTVVNIWEDWTTWPAFFLPALTHLSLDFTFGSRALSEDDIILISQAVTTILLACVHVRVCALRVDQAAASPTIAAMMDRLSDPRVVFFQHREPFQIREAHSDVEAGIWAALERAVGTHDAGGERAPESNAAGLVVFIRKRLVDLGADARSSAGPPTDAEAHNSAPSAVCPGMPPDSNSTTRVATHSRQ